MIYFLLKYWYVFLIDSLRLAANVFLVSLEMPFYWVTSHKKNMQSISKLHLTCEFFCQSDIIFLLDENWEDVLASLWVYSTKVSVSFMTLLLSSLFELLHSNNQRDIWNNGWNQQIPYLQSIENASTSMLQGPATKCI